MSTLSWSDYSHEPAQDTIAVFNYKITRGRVNNFSIWAPRFSVQIWPCRRASVLQVQREIPARFPGRQGTQVFFGINFFFFRSHQSVGVPNFLANVLKVLFHNSHSLSVVN